MSTYEIVLADGGPSVSMEAADAQVDDSGHLGLFDDTGRMVATFWAGSWSSFGIPPEPGPVTGPSTEPPTPANDTAPVVDPVDPPPAA